MENLWEQDQSDTLQEGGGDLAELNKKVKKLEACESRLEKLKKEGNYDPKAVKNYDER